MKHNLLKIEKIQLCWRHTNRYEKTRENVRENGQPLSSIIENTNDNEVRVETWGVYESTGNRSLVAIFPTKVK